MASEPGDRGLSSGDPLDASERDRAGARPAGAEPPPAAETPRAEPRIAAETPSAPPPCAAETPGAPPAPAAETPGSLWSGAGARPAEGPPPTAPARWTPPSGDPPAYLTSSAPSGLVLAGWWRRVGAHLIDGAIILAVTLILFVPLGIGLFDEDPSVFTLAFGFIVASLLAAAVALLYAPLLMARTNGQTLGRMATGIRVVRATGGPMTFGWAMLREVAVKYLLIGLAGSITFGLASLLDVLWPLWDEEKRALHDFVVDTRTVRA